MNATGLEKSALCDDAFARAGKWDHNAAYWYHRAGKPMPPAALALAEEWRQIANEVL
ncbi:MAG: hypothetical protein V4733_10525 [Verrucomicrobiota bacterium]